MQKQFPQIPNMLIANHPFAINVLVYCTILNPSEMCSFTDFETLFLITDFECFEDTENFDKYFLNMLSNRNQ